MAFSHTTPYRLALDLGSTSIGWAIFRLNEQNEPTAIIKAGVRIFSDGRNPKDGSSLAVTRREARAMRRRRDRLLKRKARMMQTLIDHGFFPKDETERKVLEKFNPYELRSKGLDQALEPGEFARALFHINQRRGFKSNRKTDKKDNDSGALKSAIKRARETLEETNCRTIGELLWQRLQAGQKVIAEQGPDAYDQSLYGVRARYRERRIPKEDGKTKIDKSYDFYIDRAMIEHEFDTLWAKQAELNPKLFNEKACAELKDCLLHQRPLKPVKPGRCTFLPDEERAPLALPSTQRFRIYQEVNNLRILGNNLKDIPLTLEQRDTIIDALEHSTKRTFTQIKKLLKLDGGTQFSIEDPKRQELKGNLTSVALSRKELFGDKWHQFPADKQDDIVMQLVKEENETRLIQWLQDNTGVDEVTAAAIANAGLPEGYGSLSKKALDRILPELENAVITYDKAVQAAGFDHHSHISHAQQTGEIMESLPYYGIPLQRHVGFGSGDPKDNEEKRYGKIANPTVHIGLNQIRLVVNHLIKRYGHPTEVIVEVARDLKQNREQRLEETKRQAENQKRNERYRADIAGVLGIQPYEVSRADIQKMILWHELSFNEADRRCPYSGQQISISMLLSDEVEIEHILPFSQTLDDSLNNKTVSLRKANRIKGKRTPWDARDDFASQGWDYDGILARAEIMPRGKRYRFAEDAMQQWDKEGKGFLARALNDTRYLSRIAREYLSLVCPQGTRVIPGQMTAMLRGKLGLNHILGPDGEKNRNDHRHHAVDACVIGITDQGMLQRFAKASAKAHEKHLNKLVDTMPDPWPTYRDHVERAISNIWVSHKPDHNHEGGMMEDTTYRPPHLDPNGMWRTRGIGGQNPKERSTDSPMIAITQSNKNRHATDENGVPLPYKGYVGGSNYCIEIVQNEKGKWEGEVISTFDAYQAAKKLGIQRLRHPSIGISGKPLVMRLNINDTVRMETSGTLQTMRMIKVASSGQIWFAPLNEANVDARNKDKTDPFNYTSKTAGSLQKAKARSITISPIGALKDPGFKE